MPAEQQSLLHNHSIHRNYASTSLPQTTENVRNDNDLDSSDDDEDDQNQNQADLSRPSTRSAVTSGSQTSCSSVYLPCNEDDDESLYSSLFTLGFFKRKGSTKWIILALVFVIGAILLSVYHNRIVRYLEPFARDVYAIRLGFLFPIVSLIIVSFPPLFGHELITVLCGLVYGLWEGFLIVAAGTFLGEIAVFFIIKYLLKDWTQRFEQRDKNFRSLARVIRNGGFFIGVIIRFSAFPSHFTTIVFSTCGVSFKIYLAAAFVTLPKQLIFVYIGTQFSTDAQNQPLSVRIISNIAVAIACIFTLFTGLLVKQRMDKERQSEQIHKYRTSSRT